jgi:hypothetical protein
LLSLNSVLYRYAASSYLYVSCILIENSVVGRHRYHHSLYCNVSDCKNKLTLNVNLSHNSGYRVVNWLINCNCYVCCGLLVQTSCLFCLRSLFFALNNLLQACDIKNPKQNIEWTVREGGGGPGYTVM